MNLRYLMESFSKLGLFDAIGFHCILVHEFSERFHQILRLFIVLFHAIRAFEHFDEDPEFFGVVHLSVGFKNLAI